MSARETAAEAWRRIIGTPYDYNRPDCQWFTTGFNAGQGRA